MPSPAHQALLLWAARRMCVDGFDVTGFAEDADQGGAWNDLPTPFLLRGFRPDAWGIHRRQPILAFAEAKTSGDVLNEHTLNQLRTFGTIKTKQGDHCPLYIAVPQSAARKLDAALIRARLVSARHVVRIRVPEVLLKGDRYAA